MLEVGRLLEVGRQWEEQGVCYEEQVRMREMVIHRLDPVVQGADRNAYE